MRTPRVLPLLEALEAGAPGPELFGHSSPAQAARSFFRRQQSLYLGPAFIRQPPDGRKPPAIHTMCGMQTCRTSRDDPKLASAFATAALTLMLA